MSNTATIAPLATTAANMATASHNAFASATQAKSPEMQRLEAQVHELEQLLNDTVITVKRHDVQIKHLDAAVNSAATLYGVL